MSPRTFVARSAAILSLAALGLAACESKTIVQPANNPLTIVVSPAAVTLTVAGQKAQFVAVVSGGQDTQAKTYTWLSSAPAVATVDANGVVTAVANGVATITATATADANVKSAGLVTVAIPVPPPVTPPAAPTISIQQVTDNAGNNVPLTNVAGQINVALNVDVPVGNTVSKVEVLVDGASACSQSFTAGSAQVGVEAVSAVTIVCSINTLALKADGSPVYTNGTHSITARLVGPAGTILASTTQTFVFNNVSALNLAVAASKQATNPNTGVIWNGGNVTVTVTPAIFSLTGNLASVTVNVGAASKSQVPTTNTGVLTFVFPDTMLQRIGVQGQTLAVTATSSTSAGVAGPLTGAVTYNGQVAPSFALDEVGPVLTGTGSSGGGFNLNGITAAPFWFGIANAWTPKALGFDPTTAAVVDAGVNNVVTKLQTSPNVSTKVWTDAPATALAFGEAAAASLLIRVNACDALGNCTNSAASPAFGIDIKPPQITGNVVPNQINPAGAYTFAVADTGVTGSVVSGTPANNVKVVEKVFTPAKTLCATDAAGTTADMPTSGSSANICASFGTTTGVGFTVPAVEGYDSVTVVAVDSAGNTSAPITKLFLTDTHVPTISSVLPANLTIAGGSSAGFNSLVADNIDIGSLSAVLAYGAVLSLNLPTQDLGTFGLPMSNAQITASYAVNPFMTSVEVLGAGGSTDATTLAETLTDQAGLSTAAPVLTLTPFLTSQATFDFAAAANGGLLTNTLTTATGNTTICVACTGLKVDTLVYTFTLPTGTATPFTGVTFYRAPTGGGQAFTPIATVSQGFVSETTTLRTITYTLVYTAAKPTGGTDFIAIGVDSKGHGLLAGPLTITINP